jgi:hypothetical protein
LPGEKLTKFGSHSLSLDADQTCIFTNRESTVFDLTACTNPSDSSEKRKLPVGKAYDQLDQSSHQSHKVTEQGVSQNLCDLNVTNKTIKLPDGSKVQKRPKLQY